MRIVGVLLLFSCAAMAQSISVTSPAASASIGGWTYNLTCSVTLISNLAYVEYLVDGEVAGYAQATEPSTCPSLTWDTYNVANGSHSFQAIALSLIDVANGTTTATSSLVSAFVENYLPQNLVAFNATPSNAAGDLLATFEYTATMAINAGATYVTNVISFKPSTTIAIVQKGYSISNVGPSQNTTAGHLLVAYTRYQSASQTFTCADTAGDTFSYSQIAQSTANGYSGGFCYAANITGRTGNQVTVTPSGGASVLTTHVWELSGALTSSPKDVDVISVSYSTIISGGFNPSTANEFVMAAGTWAAAPSVVTPGVGYTLGTADTGINAMVEYATLSPISSPPSFFGTIAVSVTNDNITPASVQIFVDGWTNGVMNGLTGGLIDTTQYQNGATHQIVVLSHGNNCPSCINGIWDFAGQAEITAAFANGTTVSQLLTSVHDQPLCTSAQSNCPTSVTLSGIWQNTDGTTTAATLASAPACVSSNTAVVTVSSSCTLTEAGVGAASVTMTDNAGRTRTMYVEVFGAPNYNILPHLGNDSAIHTSYNPSHSIILRSMFFGLGGLSPILTGPISDATCSSTANTGSINSQYAALFGTRFQAAGYNSMETLAGCLPQLGGQNQSTWQANAAATATAICSAAANYGAGVYFFFSNWLAQGSNAAGTNSGPATGWTPLPAIQYIVNQFASHPGCGLGSWGWDEITSIYGGNPTQGLSTGGVKLGTNTVGSTLTCNSGSCSVPVGSGFSLASSGALLVTGSGNSTLDYNTTSGCASAYPASVSGGTLTFTGVGSLTATFTASGYPNLILEPYATSTFDVNGRSYPASSGPCPYYARYTLFGNIYSAVAGVSGHFPVAYAPQGNASNTAYQNWSSPLIADYNADVYFSQVSYTYLPTTQPLGGLYGGQIGAVRSRMAVMNLAVPFNVETTGITSNYAFHGYPVSVASCSGNAITTSGDHLIRTIYPVTRLTVTGSTNCNGNYYVIAAPNSTTLIVAAVNATFSSTGTGGTVHWQDGTTSSLGSVVITPSAYLGGYNNGNQIIFPNCTGTNNVTSKRGETFTVTGNSDSNVNSMTGWLSWATPDAACGGGNWFLVIPSIAASTGGTAYIQADNNGIAGRDWVALTSASMGPRIIFAGHTGPILIGAAGTRGYGDGSNGPGGGQDPTMLLDRTTNGGFAIQSTAINSSTGAQTFNDTNLADFQSGFSLLSNYAKSGAAAMAAANAQLVTRVDKQFILQPRYASPDCGRFVECDVRQDPSGNTILMMQSYLDAPATIAAPNLTPYWIAGKTILKRVADWQHISVTTLNAGTASDSTACQPGCYVAYVFDNSGAPFNPPAFSAQLGNVPGASKIVLEWAYTEYPFTQQTDALPQVFDCGTGTCSPPWDLNISSVNYRIAYLNPKGAILSQSGIQTQTQ